MSVADDSHQISYFKDIIDVQNIYMNNYYQITGCISSINSSSIRLSDINKAMCDITISFADANIDTSSLSVKRVITVVGKITDVSTMDSAYIVDTDLTVTASVQLVLTPIGSHTSSGVVYDHEDYREYLIADEHYNFECLYPEMHTYSSSSGSDHWTEINDIRVSEGDRFEISGYATYEEVGRVQFYSDATITCIN